MTSQFSPTTSSSPSTPTTTKNHQHQFCATKCCRDCCTLDVQTTPFTQDDDDDDNNAYDDEHDDDDNKYDDDDDDTILSIQQSSIPQPLFALSSSAPVSPETLRRHIASTKAYYARARLDTLGIPYSIEWEEDDSDDDDDDTVRGIGEGEYGDTAQRGGAGSEEMEKKKEKEEGEEN
jgi:hypothetical protein